MDESSEFGRRRMYADIYHEVGTDLGAAFAEKERQARERADEKSRERASLPT